MRKGVKASDLLAQETQDLEHQLRYMKLQLAKRKADNPKAFGGGGIWKTYSDRKQNSSRRKGVKRRGKRTGRVSSAEPGRGRRSGKNIRPIQKINSEPGDFSHHFSTAFSPTKPEIPSYDIIPPKLGRKKVNFNKMRKKDDNFRKKLKEKKVRRKDRRKKTYLKEFGDPDKVSIVNHNLKSKLADAYDFGSSSSSSSSNYRKKNTLEEVVRKRRAEKKKEEEKDTSLLGEAFREWKSITVKSKVDPSIVRQSLDQQMVAKAKKVSRKRSRNTESSSSTTTDTTTEDTQSRNMNSRNMSFGSSTATTTTTSTTQNDLSTGEYDEEASRASLQQALQDWRHGNTVNNPTERESQPEILSSSSKTTKTITENKQWWEGEYDEEESRRGFQDALKEWREGGTTKESKNVEIEVTREYEGLSDVTSGEYDEAKQSRLFQEAVMEWRKGNAAQPSPAQSSQSSQKRKQGGLIGLLEEEGGAFDLEETKGRTKVDLKVAKMKFGGGNRRRRE